MSTLIIFVAAAPFRAAIQLGDGARALLRGIDAEDDDSLLHPAVFVDELGIEIGSRARFLERSGALGTSWQAAAAGVAAARIVDSVGGEWRGSDIFALIFRRFIAVAERTFGIDIFRLVLVVPPALDEADRRALTEAGHVAGCALIELADVGDLLVAAHDAEVGQRHLHVHLDRDQMRVSLFRCGATGANPEVTRDMSESWSGERMIDRLLPRLAGEGGNESRLREFLARELPQWQARQAGEVLIDSDSGPPHAAYLPVSARRELAESVIEQVRALLTLGSVSMTQLDWIHLHGPWAAGLAPRFAALAPRARVQAAGSSTATLELAVPGPCTRPQLSSIVWADRPRGDRIAVNEAERILLLQPGAILPALFFDESFATQGFFSEVGVFAGRGEVLAQVAAIPLPRLYENRAFSRFRLRVTADTAQFFVLQAELAIDSNAYLFVYDKADCTVTEIDQRLVNALQRSGVSADRSRSMAG